MESPFHYGMSENIMRIGFIERLAREEATVSTGIY
jgi:hypothetical protein